MLRNKFKLEKILLNSVKRNKRKLGLDKDTEEGKYSFLLQVMAREMGYEVYDIVIYKRFSEDPPISLPEWKLDEIRIPVERKYFLPDGEIKLKFDLKSKGYRQKDKVSVPILVDKEDAIFKLNNFLMRCERYAKRQPLISMNRLQVDN